MENIHIKRLENKVTIENSSEENVVLGSCVVLTQTHQLKATTKTSNLYKEPSLRVGIIITKRSLRFFGEVVWESIREKKHKKR